MLYWWDKGKTEEKQTLRVCKYFKASGEEELKGKFILVAISSENLVIIRNFTSSLIFFFTTISLVFSFSLKNTL